MGTTCETTAVPARVLIVKRTGQESPSTKMRTSRLMSTGSGGEEAVFLMTPRYLRMPPQEPAKRLAADPECISHAVKWRGQKELRACTHHSDGGPRYRCFSSGSLSNPLIGPSRSARCSSPWKSISNRPYEKFGGPRQNQSSASPSGRGPVLLRRSQSAIAQKSLPYLSNSSQSCDLCCSRLYSLILHSPTST